MGPLPSRNSRINQAQPKGRKKPPLGGLKTSTITPLFPEPGIPVLQFFASDLPVTHGCSDTDMTELLLEHPDAIGRIIFLDSHDSKSISQLVWAYPVNLACLWVYQQRQPCPISTPPYYLTCPMSIYSEDEPFGLIPLDKVTQHFQCFSIKKQSPPLLALLGCV